MCGHRVTAQLLGQDGASGTLLLIPSYTHRKERGDCRHVGQSVVVRDSVVSTGDVESFWGWGVPHADRRGGGWPGIPIRICSECGRDVRDPRLDSVLPWISFASSIARIERWRNCCSAVYIGYAVEYDTWPPATLHCRARVFRRSEGRTTRSTVKLPDASLSDQRACFRARRLRDRDAVTA